MIPVAEEVALLTPVLVAALAGSLIGLERELRRKSAGLGTNVLICAGACVFAIISSRVDPLSPSRIAANILTGVGFIGAGLIWKESTSGEIRGLTTAAGIWMAAAIGLAIGYEYYLVSALGTVIAIWAPRIPRWLYNKKAARVVESTIPKMDEPTKPKEEKKDSSDAKRLELNEKKELPPV